MLRLDENPNFFRFAVMVMILLFTTIAVVNLYYQARAVTDENLFTNLPARLMIITPIAVQVLEKQPVPETTADRVHILQPGTLILRINQREPASLKHAWKLLRESPGAPDTLVVTSAGMKGKYLVCVDGFVFSESTLRWLPPSVGVIDVAKNGASDRAGMLVGDVILRINGQFFKNAQDADRIMRQSYEKRSIDYDIVRNGQAMTLTVTLARFGIPFSILFFLLSAIVYILFGAFVALARPQIKAARLLGIAFILIGFFIALMLYRMQLPVSWLTHLRGIAISFSALFGTAVFFHSDYYYPSERPRLLEVRWPRYVLYSEALVYFILGLTPIGRNIHVMGVITLIITHLIIKAIFGQKEDKEHKHLSRVIKWSGMLAGALTLGLAFLSSSMNRPVLIGFAGIPLMLLPLAQLYTIARYKLLNLRLRLRRNIQYSIASLLWLLFILICSAALFYALLAWPINLPNIRLTGSAIEVLDQPLLEKNRLMAEKGAVLLLGMGLIWLLSRLYRRVRHLIDERYYRARYDYRRSTALFNDVIGLHTGIEDLAQRLARHIAELVHLKSAAFLIFRDGKQVSAIACWGCDRPEWNGLRQEEADELLKLLQEYDTMPSFHVDYTPKAVKESMRKGDFRNLIPVRSNRTVQAAVLVGEKLSETPFSQEDLEFLAVLAGQSAVAIENLFLYEEVATQERLRHELELARRIQISSLPRQMPDIAGLEIAAVSLPATEVGGDYYDYLIEDEQTITIVVGDVSGKGISAALYMARIQGILRSLHAHSANPRDLFISTNRVLSESIEKNYFITAIGARFELSSRKILLSRAGHLPLFYYSAGEGEARLITPKGMGLGLSANERFAAELEMYELGIAPGDICMFVTDGITDAICDQDDPSGEFQLLQLLTEYSQHPLTELRDHIMSIAHISQGGQSTPADDQTLVAVRLSALS